MSLRASELTERIDAAFDAEWQRAGRGARPEAGSAELRLLFAAVAHGVLEYLKDKDSELFKTMSLRVSGGDSITYTVTDSELDLAAS
jgi:hypothetical protein